jgi:dienelactone hydrolase
MSAWDRKQSSGGFNRMIRVTTITTLLLIGMLAVVTSPAVRGQSTRPSETADHWDAKWFAYRKPAAVAVEETMPTADQVNFWKPPLKADRNAPAPKATGLAVPLTVLDTDIIHLRFTDADRNIVPALLCKPHGKEGPFPVVIATHGYMSNKAQVCAQVAPELIKRGFAVLAADMPFHGERPGTPSQIMDKTDYLKSYKNWREAVIDDRQLIDLAEHRKDLDTSHGVALAGYSMGSWISSVVGPADDRVKAMVLMVGGATELPPAALRLPQVAGTDPRQAIKHFAGRPILMLNGKNDWIVTAPMTKLLWDAAPEPKEQRWYDSGHLLPAEAYADAAQWIETTMRKQVGAR